MAGCGARAGRTTPSSFSSAASTSLRQVTADFTYFSGVTDSQVGRSFEQEETQYKVDLAVDHVLETGPLSHVLLGAVDFRRSFLGLGDEPLPSDVQLDESRHRIGDVDAKDERARKAQHAHQPERRGEANAPDRP